MDPSCVSSAAASILASVVQVRGSLYGHWDEAGTPSSERLIHELSRLRNILQETEEAALMVPVPVILYELPEVFEETAKLLQQLKSRLQGTTGDAANTERQDTNALDWSWRTYDTTQRMQWKLTKLDAEGYLAGLQRSISRLQRSIARVPELSYGRNAMKLSTPAVQATSALWSRRADYSSAHFDAQSKRENGTSDWILSRHEYHIWVRNDRADNVLQCPGVPGSGKTVIASVVVNHLKQFCEDSSNSNIGLAYFYFNYKSPNTVLGVALALLEQLYIQSWTLATEVLELESRAERNDIALGDVIPALLSLSSRFRKTYIVIDALDECLVGYQHDLERLLSSLVDSRCRLLVLSRPNPILRAVQGHPKIEIRPTKDDIRNFTKAQIAQSPGLRKLAEDVKEEIIETLSEGGVDHGMFILVSLHLRSLLELADVSKRAVKRKLNTLKNTTVAVYDDVLIRIGSQGDEQKAVADHILTCLYHARRPLFARELDEYVSFSQLPNTDAKTSVDHRAHLQSCMGLVIENPSDGTVSFAHLSVRECLDKRAHSENPPPANETLMAIMCLQYLLQPGLEASIEDAAQLRDRVERFPFYLYAAKHWGLHATHVEDKALRGLLRTFLDDDQRSQASAQVIFGEEGSLDSEDGITLSWRAVPSTDLHLMAHFGLARLVSKRMQSRKLIGNLRDGLRRTPLHLAARRGFVECVDQLKKICDPDDLDTYRRTAFHYGAMSPNAKELIKQLAAGGKSTKIHEHRDVNGYLPLDLASKNGQLDAVDALLDIAAAPEKALVSALSAALEGGHLGICKLLLARGARIDPKHLSGAVKSGFDAGVKLLLDYGADVNSVSEGEPPPLHAAAAAGKHEILQSLIPFADLQKRDLDERTAAACAIQHGNLQALQILTKAGADLNVLVDKHLFALDFAASQGMDDIVQFLLRAGLEPKPAITDAIRNGKVSTVNLLINAGAALDGASPDVQTALERAAEMGHESMVQFLLGRGVKRPRTVFFESSRESEALLEKSPDSSSSEHGAETSVRESDLELDAVKAGPDQHPKKGNLADAPYVYGSMEKESPVPASRPLPTIPIGGGVKVKPDSASDYPAFILLNHPINLGELNLGTIVTNPLSPLDAFSPLNQADLRDLLKQHDFVLTVRNFDMSTTIERESNTSVRSWLENARGKDRGMMLSAAAVKRHSLVNHAWAVEVIIDRYRREVLQLMKGKAYIIVGLLEFADGTIRRTSTGSISVGADMAGVGPIGPSASIGRANRSNYEASYHGKRIFAIQYRILQYRRSSIFGSKRIQLEGYISKSAAKTRGATFM